MAVVILENTKTDIYEDKQFFGGYLETTSEKDLFASIFADVVSERKFVNLLDLGCFDGSLTKRILQQLKTKSCLPASVTAVEPATLPLQEFEKSRPENVEITDWQFVNSTMETFLTQNTERFDWAIVSHSMYWMKSPFETLQKIAASCKSGVMVIRDSGLLHMIEKKYRPLMTTQQKQFYSSAELTLILGQIKVPYKTSSFKASMAVPDVSSPNFKPLVGFLLDLTLEQIREDLLPELQQDLCVKDGRAQYGIDLIWFGEVLYDLK